MAIVVAPAQLDDLPEAFDGDVFGDYRALAVWQATCRLVERREPINLSTVRTELERWAGHGELHWYERPSVTWPWSLVDIADVLADRLARDPVSLPIAAWARTLMHLAANRRALVELDEDIEIEAPEAPEVRTAA